VAHQGCQRGRAVAPRRIGKGGEKPIGEKREPFSTCCACFEKKKKKAYLSDKRETKKRTERRSSRICRRDGKRREKRYRTRKELSLPPDWGKKGVFTGEGTSSPRKKKSGKEEEGTLITHLRRRERKENRT